MADSKQEEGKSCFVVMPVTTPSIYVERFNDSDHFKHVLAHLFAPALKQLGFAVIPPSVRGGELIHGEIIRNLEQADLVLCDLSSLNPNVFFELGIRTSLDRPAALVKDNLTTQIPFDLNAINTLTYESSLAPWMLDAEVARLVEHVRDTINSSNPGNSMWNYFGLTKRGAPAEVGGNPIEAKLDFIIREFEKFQSDAYSVRSGYREAPGEPGSIKSLVSASLSQRNLRGYDSIVSVDETGRSITIQIIDPRNNFTTEMANDLRDDLQSYFVYRVHVATVPF